MVKDHIPIEQLPSRFHISIEENKQWAPGIDHVRVHKLHEDERGKVNFAWHIYTTWFHIDILVSDGYAYTLAIDEVFWKFVTITLTSHFLED